MKLLRKTVLTVVVPLFCVVLALFLTTLVAASCTDKVTMSFETFGGTKIEAISTSAGEQINSPADPKKDGYVFVGWYLDKTLEGESQALPAVMPTASVTYYARFEQYPSITLQTNGGTLETDFYYLKEGSSLSEFLRDIVPVKQGLTFGGWLWEGESVDSAMQMPEEDITLTARYVASYRVEQYVQSAQSQTQFDLAEQAEYIGWEGSFVTPAVLPRENFEFSKELSTATEGALKGGENVFRYYFKRKPCEVTYSSAFSGEEEQITQNSYYGAQLRLPSRECAAEGYAFFGWATQPNGRAVYLAGDTFEVFEEHNELYAVWGKTYADGRGSGKTLVLSERGQNGYVDALLCGDRIVRGEYCPDNGFFTAGEFSGKLDEHGNFLLSDSGVYAGYRLDCNKTDEKFGVLSLEFETGKATYSLGEETITGEYRYLYDEVNARYLQRYAFSSEGKSFTFALGEGNFLKEGEEKGKYYAYEREKETFTSAYLQLDGFGNALLCRGDELIEASYLGCGENEWILTVNDEQIRVLLCVSERTLNGSVIQSTPVYLTYRQEERGQFTCESGETVVLDGYGYRAQFVGTGGERTGIYRVEGNNVQLIFANGEQKTVICDWQNFTFCIAN